MGRMATSWRLTKESWGVIKQDKELMWMPVLSFLASLVAMAAVAGITFSAWPAIYDADTQSISPLGTALSLLLYIALVFIAIYFQAATIAAAHERLEGGDPTIRSGLRAANKHLGKIFLWALFVATINLILQAIRERVGPVGKFLVAMAGAAWNLATYFVIPGLLFSGEGVGGSLRQSGRLFKQRWGETVAGHIGISYVFGIFAIAWLFLGLLLTAGLNSVLGTIGLFVGIGLALLGLIVIVIIGAVLGGVYKAALYRYAVTEDSGPFSDLGSVAY